MKIDINKLQEMIKEAISEYTIGEAPLSGSARQDMFKRLGKNPTARSIPVGQLIAALMKAKAKTPVMTKDQLLGLLDSPELLISPTGPGSGLSATSQAATQGSLSRALTPTGGAPVRPAMESKEPKETTITVSEAELKEMVNTIVESRLLKEFDMSGMFPGNNPIMAKREIIALMDSTSRNFENEIVKTFRLQNPDSLSPELQRRYLEIVEEMKTKLIQAAMAAVRDLIAFPKQNEGNGNLKK
jgi:hypothetical protein